MEVNIDKDTVGGVMVQQVSVLTVLSICSYEDLKNKQIHTGWIVIFAAEGILFWFFGGNCTFAGVMSALFPGFCMLLLSFITKGSIGEGDGLLLMTIGILSGGKDVLEIFLYALFFSGIYALFLFAAGKKKGNDEIAFVPFLLLAFVGNMLG